MKNFTAKNLYDEKGIGKDGQEIRKMSVIYNDGNNTKHLCDMCDEEKQCTHIADLMLGHGGMISVICKDCLQLIVDELNKPNEDEQTYQELTEEIKNAH
jgi:hypothetical protein